MLQKLNSRRGGFTLVEIMIVVAIIALLATIAVPNFLRARLRSQATACKQDLRMLDAAIEQYAIENNKKPTDAVAFANLKPYIKENSTSMWRPICIDESEWRLIVLALLFSMLERFHC